MVFPNLYSIIAGQEEESPHSTPDSLQCLRGTRPGPSSLWRSENNDPLNYVCRQTHWLNSCAEFDTEKSVQDPNLSKKCSSLIFDQIKDTFRQESSQLNV